MKNNILLFLILLSVELVSGQALNDFNSILEDSVNHYYTHYCSDGKEVVFCVGGDFYDIIEKESSDCMNDEAYVVHCPLDVKRLKRGMYYYYVDVQFSINKDKLCVTFANNQVNRIRGNKLSIETNGCAYYIYQYSKEKESWMLMDVSAHAI